MGETDDRYWDCACDTEYIHIKEDTLECNKCGSTESECPDSMVSELIRYGFINPEGVPIHG